MDNFKDYEIIFNCDIKKHALNEKVCVTGVVSKKWRRRDGGFGLQIQDLTGLVTISFSNNDIRYERTQFTKGKHVRVYACIAFDEKEMPYLHDVADIELLDEINQWRQEYDIMEQESLVLISKICNIIRTGLSEQNFVEVNTRIITRNIGEEILEPLLAVYPGYGSPAYLIPSPSSQLAEFLAVTLLPKVFTETVSITSSYRFPNGATELPIIMAKAINLPLKGLQEIVLKISHHILSSLSDEKYQVKHVECEWGNESARHELCDQNYFIYYTYSTNIASIGKRWSSILNTICQLKDEKDNLLAECAVETVNEHIKISTITFYPTQYLNWIKKAPKRQLLNLWKLYDGGNIYA